MMVYHRTLNIFLVLYSRILLLIQSIYTSLHLLIPDSQSNPPHPCSLLATSSLSSVSVSLFLFCRWVHFCHILVAMYKWYRGGHGNPFHCYCLENPMDWGACWATVRRTAKRQTWLKWLSIAHKWYHGICLWLFSLSMIISRSLHVAASGILLHDLVVFHCVYKMWLVQ